MRAAPSMFRFAVSSFAAIGCWMGSAQAQPVLDLEGTTLTSYLPTARTLRQDLRPRFDQRGVDIDGTLRSPSAQGWSLAADNLGGGYGGGRKIGDIMLAQGAYNPTDIDLALPTLGPPVMIGRTYNAVQVAGGSRGDSNGYQGFNWSQIAAPELQFKAGTTSDLDVVYLVYGADRYIEFKRTGVGNNEFKAKNGAAGVMQFASGGGTAPDIYTYFDQRGNTSRFFGFDTNSGVAQGQLWTITDAAGQVMYVGSTASAAAAISAGFNADGYITTMFDASGRRYTFTYGSTALGGTKRLTQVAAATFNGSAWVNVGTVDYGYYDGVTETSAGGAGDLRVVTVTLPDSVGGNYVTNRYYRYYTAAWSAGAPGILHGIKLAVGPEGVRKAGGVSGAVALSDTTLQDYADAYLEYASTADNRITKAILNGGCGCAGGSGVTYFFSYDAISTYSTLTSNTTYDADLAQRTIIQQPDGTYIAQYFDEAAQPRARVVAKTSAFGSGAVWVTEVARNSSGQVTQIRSPESVTTYTHAAPWSISASASAGMVTEFSRFTTPTNLVGLRQSTGVRPGTGGTLVTLSAVTLNERQRVVGTSGVVVPVVATSATYPSGSALTTTITTSWWDNTTNTNAQYIAPKEIDIAAPAVSTANNGSNSATTNSRYLRADGSTAFSKDAIGTIFYSGRDAFGNTSVSIADVSTSSGSIASGDAATNWSLSSSGTPIGATTSYTYDAQGRMTQAAVPSVSGTRTQGTVYTALGDGRLQIMTSSDMSGANYLGPISVNVTNQSGRSEMQGVVQLTTAGSMPSGTPTAANWQRLSTTVYDSAGARPTESRMYTVIPSSLPGTSGTNYDPTTYGYDSMGRRERSVDATGTITRTVFEERGLPIATWIGTSDSGFTAGSGGGDMTKVQTVEYDGGSAGKNGWATTRTQKPTSSSSDDRITTTQYDYRGRAIVQIGPVSPYSVMKYDDLSRVIAAGQFSSSSGLTTSTDPTSTATNRVGLSETVYDERGQVARTTQWQIVQSSGAKATGATPSIVTDNWYDDAGRSIKRQGTTISKSSYDRLGRSVAQWLLAKTNDTVYADATGVSGDIVLEESRTALDAATGRALMQWSISRRHDDTVSGTTGQLDTTALGSSSINGIIKGRVQVSAMWYDQFDRVTGSAQLGTAGVVGSGSGTETYSRPGSAPSTTDTVLVTSRSYNGWGGTYRVTDPNGIINQTDYDNAGRTIRVNSDYVDGTAGGGSSNDQDRIVEYTYSAGLTATVTRKMPSSADDQLTTYTYGVVKTGTRPSEVASNRLLASVVYPPQSSGQAASDRTAGYSYNALGQTKTTIDPAGNVITSTYDVGGRITARVATTVASGFDATVNRIETSYDARGMMAGTLQKNSGGTVLDEVQMAYNDWGSLSTFTQDPDSAISGGTGRASYQLTYTTVRNSATGGWQNMKMTGWTQPGGVAPKLAFGSSGGIGDLTGRVDTITDQTFATIASYSYLGAATVVGVGMNEPNMQNNLYGTGGSADYGSFMDTFNRPTRQKWERPLSGTGITPPNFVDRTMKWDRVHNLVALTETSLQTYGGTPNYDLLFAYDNLRRLSSVNEGQLNGTMTALTTTNRTQALGRNLAGRVTSDQLDLDANGTFTNGPPNATAFGEMNDARTYNQRNELTSRSVLDSSNPSTPRTVTLTYDKNGNMTSDGERYKYTFNPWGQVTQIQTIASVVAGNIRYNGLGMRISEQFDTNKSGNSGTPDGVVDSNDPTFFIVNDMQGRRVGTFRGTDTNPKETFVHHPATVRGVAFRGGIILRDRDNDTVGGTNLSNPTNWAKVAAGSTRSERHYPTTDIRGNTVALLDNAGKLVEQFRYSATGVPIGIPLGDVSGKGSVNAGTTGTTDYTTVNGAIGGAYKATYDLNMDGKIDTADVAIVTAQGGTTTGRGKLSRDSVAWRPGQGRMEWQGTLGTYRAGSGVYDAVTGVGTGNRATSDAPMLNPRGREPTGAAGARSIPVVPPVRVVPPVSPRVPCYTELENDDCQTRCSAAPRTLGFVDRDADGVPTLCCICTRNIPLWIETPDPNLRNTYDELIEIATRCARVHETTHTGQRGGTTACRECEAYSREYGCLAQAQMTCTTPQCQELLEIQLAILAGYVDLYCSVCDQRTDYPVHPYFSRSNGNSDL